jgi:hypothetical protein
MRKALITLATIFCLIFTTHALARSNEYYKLVVVNALMNDCSTKCKKTIFESEIEMAVYHLMKSIIAELQFQLSQKRKERLWGKSF